MEQVQHARVIRILHVLQVQLPVRLRILARAAEILHRLVEDPVDPRAHLLAEILGQRRDRVAEGREHEAAIAVDAQLAQPVLLRIEIRGHPRHPLLAAPERHAEQVAGVVEAPLVIHARVRARVAARLAAHLRAAVRAAVHPCGERAVVGARDDHGRIADERALEVARVRDLRLQRDEIPRRAAIDAFLLALVDGPRTEHLVRHARAVVVRKLHVGRVIARRKQDGGFGLLHVGLLVDPVSLI